VSVQVTEAGTSRFAETGTWTYHYHEAGQGHPLVLVHGSGPASGGWSTFCHIIPGLSERFRVLAIDMPGWGKSTPAPFDAARQADDLASFLDALGIENAALAGNSLGGMAVVRLAMDHPERVSHMITLGSPAPGADLFVTRGRMSEAQEALLATYLDPSAGNFRRLSSALVYDQGFSTDDLARDRSESARENAVHLANFLAGMPASTGSMAAYAEAGARLAQVTIPALIIHGRDDRMVSFESALRFVSLIGNSRLLLLNRCGHWPQTEHPVEVAHVMADFICDQSSATAPR
jgi:2-hydroxy-6-oxonona-2,4-dienedioate hydrolase